MTDPSPDSLPAGFTTSKPLDHLGQVQSRAYFGRVPSASKKQAAAPKKKAAAPRKKAPPLRSNSSESEKSFANQLDSFKNPDLLNLSSSSDKDDDDDCRLLDEAVAWANKEQQLKMLVKDVMETKAQKYLEKHQDSKNALLATCIGLTTTDGNNRELGDMEYEPYALLEQKKCTTRSPDTALPGSFAMLIRHWHACSPVHKFR